MAYQSWYNYGMTRKLQAKLEVRFFKSDGGVEPVRTWLKELPTIERKAIGEDIKLFNLAGRLACLWLSIWMGKYGKFEPD